MEGLIEDLLVIDDEIISNGENNIYLLMKIVLILLLVALVTCLRDLSNIEETDLVPLFSGDWQTALPENIQKTHADLLKLLDPKALKPVHAAVTKRHYRLTHPETKF